MRVNEIFHSLQGEGLLAGVPSVFIRIAGCPLRCKWCDTRYCWDPAAGADHPIDKVVEIAAKVSCSHVVITGGEPMINPDLSQLARKLKGRDKHITIETAGIVFVPDLVCDLMSISPKTSNSAPDDDKLRQAHEEIRLNVDVLRNLTSNYDYQLKFVVESPADLPEIQETIDRIGNIKLERVMLMPQAATREQLLAKSLTVAELCKQTSFAFCNRLHVLLWNNRRGT